MIILSVLSILMAVLLTINIRHKSPETVYASDNLIRLHVIANSDSAADQDLKRKVRDEIVRYAAPEFLRAENMDSARLIARANLGGIKEIASREIEAEGRDYPVSVELDSFSFPTKHYGPFVLPAGDYEAVRVTIGAGGGANWWCVLFPPLCFVDMSKAAESFRPEYSVPAPTVSVQSNNGIANHAAGPEVPKMVAASIETDDAAPPADTYTEVEYRFRILDFIKKIF